MSEKSKITENPSKHFASEELVIDKDRFAEIMKGSSVYNHITEHSNDQDEIMEEINKTFKVKNTREKTMLVCTIISVVFAILGVIVSCVSLYISLRPHE